MIEMIKRIVFLLIFFYGLTVVDCGLTYAQEAVKETAQEKAEEYHKIASSDVIYSTQELKALYYQNIQIIDLLKEIRNLLKQSAEKEK